jgi:hypothetical protein
MIMSVVKIEPTGTHMIGVCSVKTKVCVAPKRPEPITAVWQLPERTQINVCGACLAKELETGAWEEEMPRTVRPPLDMSLLELTVRSALIPESQGTRAELIQYLKKEIGQTREEWKRHPNLPKLSEWLQQLEGVH